MSFEALGWAIKQVERAELNSCSRFVLILLANATSDEVGTCYPSYGYMVRKTGFSLEAVRSACKVLRSLGLLEIEPRLRENKANTSNIYRLRLDTPPPPTVGGYPLIGGGAPPQGLAPPPPMGGGLESKELTSGFTKVKPPTPKIEFNFETLKFENIGGDLLTRWREAYPAIDIEVEIKQAAVWLDANPKNRKSNYYRFLCNWMSKEQDRAPRVAVPQKSGDPECVRCHGTLRNGHTMAPDGRVCSQCFADSMKPARKKSGEKMEVGYGG